MKHSNAKRGLTRPPHSTSIKVAARKRPYQLSLLGVALVHLPGCGADSVKPEAFDQNGQALSASINVRVSSSADDAEESSTGSMSLTSTDVELVTDGSRGAQRVGMRFTGLNIPNSANISSAHLTFTTDETNSGTTQLTIRAQDIDDAPGFTTSSGNISNRSLTSASVSWSPGAWNTIGQTHQSPDLSSLIQEVVARSGWNAGNDLVIVITGSGERTAEAFDGVASLAPLLQIEYDDGASGPACGDGNCSETESCSSCSADCGNCSGGGAAAVWLEAESGSFSGNPGFAVEADSSASGSTRIQPTANSLSSPGPNRVSYSVNIQAGTYKLWGRVSAPNSNDDSFWVRVNGGTFVRWNDIGSGSGWHWDEVHDSDNGGSVMQYTLSQGQHTIEIANREDGTRLDKLYLTKNGDTPSGLGGDSGPTCNDGTQNQGETEVDCGGPCPECPQPCEGSCAETTVPNLLIAFIGDQGNNGNSTSVLQLIAAEGADAVVHNGDFDYQDDPSAWDNRITNVLGSSYPYFTVIGNHDVAAWGGSNGYAAKIQARHARNPEMVCSGELSVRANCTFRGLHLVQSCIGTNELRSSCNANSSDQVNFIRDSLASSNATFKVCNWHKNQHDMQVGAKPDEVGWNAYRECMAAGAIVSTGHEHSYSRTLTLTDVGNSAAGHGATGAFDLMSLSNGRNFAFVSGLAGVGIRAFSTSHNNDTWWASYYAGTRWLMNGVLKSGTAAYGALFIRFHVDGDPSKAHGYFKDVNGRIADEFVIQVQ